MKLKLSKQVYQWTEDGEHRIGRIVQCVGMLRDQRNLIVQRYHTGELHIVRASELKPYPSSPIPEPPDRTRQIVEAGGPTH